MSSGIDETALPQEPHILMAKWVEEACNCKEVSSRVSIPLREPTWSRPPWFLVATES